MPSPAVPQQLRRLRLTPLATALLIASPVYALELQPQVITGNPLGSSQLASPTTVLEGDDLTLLQQGHVQRPGPAL